MGRGSLTTSEWQKPGKPVKKRSSSSSSSRESEALINAYRSAKTRGAVITRGSPFSSSSARDLLPSSGSRRVPAVVCDRSRTWYCPGIQSVFIFSKKILSSCGLLWKCVSVSTPLYCQAKQAQPVVCTIKTQTKEITWKSKHALIGANPYSPRS